MNDDLERAKAWLLALRSGDRSAIAPLLEIYTHPATAEAVRERIRDANWLEEAIRDAFARELEPPWNQPEYRKFTFWQLIRLIVGRPAPQHAVQKVYTLELYERELLYMSLIDGLWGPYDVREAFNKLQQQARQDGVEVEAVHARIAAVSSAAFRSILLPDQPAAQYRNRWERVPLES